MLQALDGPGTYGTLSVTTTATEVKVGGTALDERKIVSIQPINGDVYFGYDASVTTSTGTKIFKSQYFQLEASDTLPVYLIVVSGSVDCRITEVS